MSVDLIRATLHEPLAGVGLVVEDVGVRQAGRRQVVRVAVDRDLAALELASDRTPVRPLSLDEIAEATRLVSEVLDDADVMGPAAYVLEVSSPGVDRPLTQPRQLRRNVGRLVILTPVEGDPLTGRIAAVGVDELVLQTERGEVRMPLTRVRQARVQVEFARADGAADEGADESSDGVGESG